MKSEVTYENTQREIKKIQEQLYLKNLHSLLERARELLKTQEAEGYPGAYRIVEVALPEGLSHVKMLGGKDLRIINTNYTGGNSEIETIYLKDYKF